MTKIKATRRPKKARRKTSRTPKAPPPGARAKILEVATELFAEHGLEGVSVRDISRAADVNVSLISYYFDGKEGLYRAIVSEHTDSVQSFFGETVERFQRLAPSKENFAEQLRVMIGFCVRMKIENPKRIRLLERERMNGLPYARAIVEKLVDRISKETFEIVQRAKAQGILRKDVNACAFHFTIAESIWGYMNLCEMLPKAVEGGFRMPQDYEEYIEFLVRLFTEGVYK